MYLEFFGLHRHPFRITPEDDFIYMSQQHSRAYVYMSSAIWSSEGFVVISGEIGSGKTTLLKKTIRNLEGDLKLLNISYTNLESKDLFGLILRKAGMKIEDDSKVAMLFQITEYLEGMAAAGTPVVLTIDEAQNLSRENLEDIRMLTGMESMGGPSMRVILLGQPELKKAVSDIPQLSQRVKLFFHLEGLTAAETAEYIDYRLLVSGHGGNKLFDDDTVREIHKLSKGIPRLINKLCDGMMMCAYSEDRPFIDPFDLKGIRRDLLGEDTSTEAPRRQATRRQSGGGAKERRPQNNPAMPSNDALSRIATALERIDSRLEQLTSRSTEESREPARHPDNVKPLSPNRK
ncbi:Type II secretory pathway, component ExeA (predicted ATPase) [Marinobacter sp. DSM 26671]|uniref:AAA family ATPase n=1 Tax=Marinobacter sp. DSM 26671 TaxID=1761793 RepID=UPI0008E4A970|nr:AAA family ATPase [Marinobacter sp. DSM 26671]PTB93721.1 AAA family ATPase [Marinobacter sp. B9-2]SFD91115.1 Type II secretory pathway, component ExeA (predicted ATPase) [Marinobacter sp. DSM 26671]